MRVEYHETSLKAVMEYYIKGFKLRKSESIWSHETFWDPSGKMIVKMFIPEEKKDEGIQNS